MILRYIKHALLFVILCATVQVNAAPYNLANSPLFIGEEAPPLAMIVLGRDHKLYYEAYNDASDLDGDGVLDTRYKPSIDYYGYFNSNACYFYTSFGRVFTPVSTTATKKCSGSLWSGDFLNYLTMSRMDVLRKVLYGGYRSTDTSFLTVLERSYIPQDAHSWGKEYTSTAVDGYDIADYTPYTQPESGKRHLFANTTLKDGNGAPLLRVAPNQPYRIWEWLSIERPVAGNRVQHGSSGPNIGSQITDYTVRVITCTLFTNDTTCQKYPNGLFKPVGLLQTFGETDKMKFGLLTGSYNKNLSGGVLRKNISSLSDEINPETGEFTSTNGIIKNIDKLKIYGFGGNYLYNQNCGFIFNRDIVEGECNMWGNPIAEIMYETIRYFAGKGSPTSAFNYSGGVDASLGLAKPNWINPYADDQFPKCAKPNMIVISDINPSYDTDQVPGSAFASFTGDLSPALNASSLGATIWQNEFGGTRSHFIGQSGNDNNGAPTAKAVSSFGNIRGLAPEEPNKQGGYYAASVAYYGWLNDVNSVDTPQKVHTYAVALASALPKINIDVNGKIITLVPFAKSVGTSNRINRAEGEFQPTNTIVDFYVESLTPTSGTFRINFEDAQQGADHDMDAIVKYSYQVNPDNTVTITLESIYAAGSIQQHMGYVISGTTADGTYLEVRDTDTSAGSDPDYFLDTPPGAQPGEGWEDSQALPLATSRTFTPSSTPAATILPNPLWFAAKWGSFVDKNNNNIPDLAEEYDSNGDGIPDNYYLATNALTLYKQLEKTFQSISERQGVANSTALNSGSLSNESGIFIGQFNTKTWHGSLMMFKLNPTTGAIDISGPATNGAQWEYASILNTLNYNSGRHIITYNRTSERGVAFRWDEDGDDDTISALLINYLKIDPTTGLADDRGEDRLNYLRGDREHEIENGGNFRNRVNVLGDIIFSSPVYIGKPSFRYENWPNGASETSYNAYKTTQASRTPMLAVGANDGMLHILNADTGAHLLNYIPSAVHKNLNKLTQSEYSHRYFVDGSPIQGDVFFDGAWHTALVGTLNRGGQGIYALDVTNPSAFNENNAESIVLWEFNDDNDADLGYTYGQAAIVRLANGKWGAVVSNGYNNTESDDHVSSTGNAVLFIIDVETGAVIKKLDTGVGMAQDPKGEGRPNGLSTPLVVDKDGDHIADTIYAGDLFGNLWKFDISGSSTGSWQIAFSGSPLFVAKSNPSDESTRQPITSRPNAIKVPGMIDVLQITFGTGKYLEHPDTTDLSIQTFYSIRDEGSPVASRSNLLEQTITLERTIGSAEYRVTSRNTLNENHKGWYLDLVYNGQAKGERLISNPVIIGNKIVFTTLIPAPDPCEYGGSGWLMALDALSGIRFEVSVFDLNQDNVFNADDNIAVSDESGADETSVSGIKSTAGIIGDPKIISNKTTEFVYLSGTNGTIQKVSSNPGVNVEGRQSWRQIR